MSSNHPTNNRRFWIPHIGSLPHDTSPSKRTYCIQMRVPVKEFGDNYVALTNFTLDYHEALRWLHAHRERAGRHLLESRIIPPLIGT